MNGAAGVTYAEERIHLERLRASVLKEQMELRLEKAIWERDRIKAERDELSVRLTRLQTTLDRERRRVHRYTPSAILQPPPRAEDSVQI